MTTPPVSLSAVERTEIKWALRSQNALARYLNWLSLRAPWAWRIRLDLVLLLNLVLGLAVLLWLGMLPDEESGDYRIYSVIGFLYLGVSIAVLAAAFFWAFTVTKSVRARAAPRLGAQPGILTSIVVCASFGFWILVAGAGPYVGVLRDAGTGSYREGYQAVTAEETTAAVVDAGPAIQSGASAEAQAAAAAEAAQLKADQDARIAREAARVANLRRASLWGALFGKHVHAFWAPQYSGDNPPASESLALFIQTTPRWRDDEALQSILRMEIPHAAYPYPGLLEDFKGSQIYNEALVRYFASQNNYYYETTSAAITPLRELAESTPEDMRARFRTYLSDLYHNDDVLNTYVNNLRTWIDSNDPERSAELRRLSNVIERYEEQDRYDPLDSEEYSTYLETYRVYRRLLADPATNQSFQQSGSYREYIQSRFISEVREGLHGDKIRAERAFHEMVGKIENGGDPSRNMPEQQLRQDLLSSWMFGAVTVTIAALLLAVFVTSLNRTGLGATLGSMGLAAALSAVVGIAAAFAYAPIAAWIESADSTYLAFGYLVTGALLVILVCLALPIRDVLTGVRRRWSRPLALAAIWSSVGWFPVIISSLSSTPLIQDMDANNMALWVAFTLATLASVAIFAKLVFALVGRISTYPQPG